MQSGGEAMHLTQELLGHAQAKLKKAELALEAKPTNRWLKMAVEFLRDEVETLKRLQIKYDNREPSQRQSG
jgi:hypothetical protein